MLDRPIESGIEIVFVWCCGPTLNWIGENQREKRTGTWILEFHETVHEREKEKERERDDFEFSPGWHDCVEQRPRPGVTPRSARGAALRAASSPLSG